MVSAVEQEIQNLLLCSECYENAYKSPMDSFVIPCTLPHILLWVDFPNLGFWPAKLMKYNEEKMVSVRFFEDHTNACLSSSNCYILSEVLPEDGRHSPSAAYNLALAVSLTFEPLSF